jgi:polyisoprenyl-phosphate glycosyltransferase
MNKKPQISIVIPLFNEEEIFPFLKERLLKLLEEVNFEIEIVLVNDGSADKTLELIQETAEENEQFIGLDLSRNFGHQIAFSAGMSVASGSECVLLMDGDLQDPPELLRQFYGYYRQGYDVVYAIRKKRKEGFFKKIAYKLYYRIQKKVSNINIPIDCGDFSLISRRVVDILNQMPEESRYLRGMRSWVGFKQIGIEYDRDARLAGEPKYTFRNLLKLAFNGIFNFSELPIKIVTYLGIFTFSAAFIYFITVLYKKIAYDSVPEGFTALLFTIILFGGLQFLAIGLIGEYILRIFFQSKRRPLFIIKSIIRKTNQEKTSPDEKDKSE